jgi:hypothetical protein
MSAIRFGLALVAACGLGFAVADFRPANAAETNNPPPPAPAQSAPKSDATSTKKKTPKKKNETKSEQQFLDGYRSAHAMIYQQHEFNAGIARLRALGHDDHPDVANLIGYSSRKLGRYDDAKLWYEKALAPPAAAPSPDWPGRDRVWPRRPGPRASASLAPSDRG